MAAHQREGSFLDVPAVEQIGGRPDDTHAGETNGTSTFCSSAPRTSRACWPLGHYEVLDIAGKGGMGIVLRAYDEKLHRPVTIKVLAPHLATTGWAQQRFVREAQAAASVVHDNVIAIHAVDDEDPAPYLVMQFIDGRTLQDKLDHSGPPSLKEILVMGYQMAARAGGGTQARSDSSRYQTRQYSAGKRRRTREDHRLGLAQGIGQRAHRAVPGASPARRIHGTRRKGKPSTATICSVSAASSTRCVPAIPRSGPATPSPL